MVYPHIIYFTICNILQVTTTTHTQDYTIWQVASNLVGCFITIANNKGYNQLKITIPPGGELNVAPTRHRVTCGSKPGVGGIF